MKCCVVFDSKGNIQHVHRVVTLEGAPQASDRDVAQRALSLAKERGLDTSKLDVVSVDPNLFEPNAEYRVDVKKKSVVRVDSSPSKGKVSRKKKPVSSSRKKR